jgi:hypothetical protein
VIAGRPPHADALSGVRGGHRGRRDNPDLFRWVRTTIETRSGIHREEVVAARYEQSAIRRPLPDAATLEAATTATLDPASRGDKRHESAGSVNTT